MYVFKEHRKKEGVVVHIGEKASLLPNQNFLGTEKIREKLFKGHFAINAGLKDSTKRIAP